MNRIILLSVDDAWIKRSGETAGASGSAGAVTLRMTFDSAWDGTSKTVYFTDALGENSVKVLLGLDALVSDNTYDVPVPGEAMTQPGQATVTVVGESEGRVITTQAARFRVLDAAIPPSAGNSQPITPDEAAQLQAQIDALEEIFVTNRKQAQDAAQQAESAKDAVQEAIDNIPPGAVLVINDLTTGGTSVALSAEQGKKLDETKADRQLSNLDTPQAALVNLGAGVRPNLVENWDFRSPINQRGIKDTIVQSGQYILDRWRVVYDSGASPKFNSQNGRISLDNSGGSGNLFFEESVELKSINENGQYTVSILCDSGLYSSGIKPDGNRIYIPDSPFNCVLQKQSDNYIFQIGVMTGSVEQLISVKLERGTVWGLIHQPESDYSTQLLKCQRYYQLYSSAENRPSKAADCRPVMRINPTQGTIVIDGVTYYYNDASL